MLVCQTKANILLFIIIRNMLTNTRIKKSKRKGNGRECAEEVPLSLSFISVGTELSVHICMYIWRLAREMNVWLLCRGEVDSANCIWESTV